jgi:hypothetical protein
MVETQLELSVVQLDKLQLSLNIGYRYITILNHQ